MGLKALHLVILLMEKKKRVSEKEKKRNRGFGFVSASDFTGPKIYIESHFISVFHRLGIPKWALHQVGVPLQTNLNDHGPTW